MTPEAKAALRRAAENYTPDGSKFHTVEEYGRKVGDPQTILSLLDEIEAANERAQRLLNLLVHVRHEVHVLEDFDADSLAREIEQAVSGEKTFDDNTVLLSQIAALKEGLRPFARIADSWTVETAEGILTLSNGKRMCALHKNDFRRAAALTTENTE